jgi:hypothetical protein
MREKSIHKTEFTRGNQLRPLNASNVLPIAQPMSEKKSFEIQKARNMQSVEPDNFEDFRPLHFELPCLGVAGY